MAWRILNPALLAFRLQLNCSEVLREAGPRLECGSCSSAPSQLRRKPKDMLPSWPLLPLVMVPMSSRLSRKGKLKASLHRKLRVFELDCFICRFQDGFDAMLLKMRWVEADIWHGVLHANSFFSCSPGKESMSMDFLQKLIQKQRSATELGASQASSALFSLSISHQMGGKQFLL